MAAEPLVATYSIVACDLDAGQWGVAVESKFLAVGSVVPWAAPHVGAIATQAYANPRYGPDGLAMLRDGTAAAEVVERLTAADGGREQRQLGLVDGTGRAATFTGSEGLDVEDAIAGELRDRLARLGFAGELEDAFARWAGNMNLEERVDGLERIDPVVLEELRELTL